MDTKRFQRPEYLLRIRETLAVTRGDKTPQELLDESIQVVEGVHMAKAALKLSEKLKVELPITKQVHDVLFSGKPPRQAMRELMERQLRDEFDGLRSIIPLARWS